VAGQNDTVHTGSVTAAQECAEVARVGDAVEGDEERRIVRTATQEKVEFDILERCGEGNDTLGCFAAGLRLETLAVDLGDLDAHRTSDLDDVVDDIVGVEVSGEPDLLDAALAGHEKLADRLTTFDLFTTEALLHGLACAGFGDATSTARAAGGELTRGGVAGATTCGATPAAAAVSAPAVSTAARSAAAATRACSTAGAT
jgi:hypothetical protein